MPRLLRSACLAAALPLAFLCAVMVPTPAQAAGTVSTTGTTTQTVPASSTTALTGLSVSDTDPSDTLAVSLSTDLGTVAIGNSTGLTLDYGYTAFTGESVSFTGSPADVNAGLASVTLTPGDTTGTAHVSLTAMVSAPGYVFSAPNGHFYRFVSSANITWSNARTAAATMTFHGQAGYLGTIPNDEVNDLISDRISGATNTWIGAESTDTPSAAIKRTWAWQDGPLAGQPISYCSNFVGACDFVNDTGLFSAWVAPEPNNYQGGSTAHSGEYVAVTNWQGTSGQWNDLANTNNAISGYLVEYGDQVNGSTGFTGVSTSASDVAVDPAPAPNPAPVAPGSPRGLTAAGSDRSLFLGFSAPADPSSPAPTGYQVSLDAGQTWKPLTTAGSSSLSATVPRVLNGQAYAVQVRGTASGNPGAPTAVQLVTVGQWFVDPIAKKTRTREIAVPRKPSRYTGRTRSTVATNRSADGHSATALSLLHGRQLQAGQGVQMPARRLFDSGSSQLSDAGRKRVATLAASLVWVDGLRCEGYADYDATRAAAAKLSTSRARAVCAALAADGVQSTMVSNGYGLTRPQIVSTRAKQRGGNNRIVLLATGS